MADKYFGEPGILTLEMAQAIAGRLMSERAAMVLYDEDFAASQLERMMRGIPKAPTGTGSMNPCSEIPLTDTPPPRFK